MSSLTVTSKPHAVPTSPAFLRAMSAETLKAKRTLVFWLTLIAPAVVAGLQLILLLRRSDQIPGGESAWISLIRQTLILWVLLMQPLFITLNTALVAQLDHSGDNWKHLFTLSIPRWAIYAAKQVISLLLIGLSLVVLIDYTLIVGRLMQLIHPNLGFDQPIPWNETIHLTLLGFFGSWLVTAIHNFVALYWRSFVVASAFGIAMTIAGVVIINSEYAWLYPWTLSPSLLNLASRGGTLIEQANLLAYSMIGGLLVALVGCLLFIRRDIL